MYKYSLPMGIFVFLSILLLTPSAVSVSFNENRYTVADSDGQVSVSLRIDGRFFVPVWTIVEISEGTATGGLCMLLGMNIYEHRLLTKLLATVCAYAYV